jgi:extradiol dioxygenase family protein
MSGTNYAQELNFKGIQIRHHMKKCYKTLNLDFFGIQISCHVKKPCTNAKKYALELSSSNIKTFHCIKNACY